MPVDLSQVLFIATANRKDTIPAPLLDRMEVIELAGYTREDKIAIAREFLVPRQLADHGLTPRAPRDHRRGASKAGHRVHSEAGVRHLAQQVARSAATVAVRVASGDSAHIDADAEFVDESARPAEVRARVAENTPAPGIATTLTWTPGRAARCMLVESTRMPGHGEVHLTGKMGDVLKESAAAAFSYIRSRAQRFGLQDDFLNTHRRARALAQGRRCPRTARRIGLSIFVSLISMLRGMPVRPDVAVTGEITLRGKVLRVDGLKQKCLAAHHAGIQHVVLPRANERDLDDVPEQIRKRSRIHLVSKVDEALALVLDGAGAGAARAADTRRRPRLTAAMRSVLAQRVRATQRARPLDRVHGARPAACARMPLLGVQGVESALVLGVIVPLFAAGWARAARSRHARRRRQSAPLRCSRHAACLRSACVLALPMLVLWLNALRVRNCAPLEGLAFMLLGPGRRRACSHALLGACVGALVPRAAARDHAARCCPASAMRCALMRLLTRRRRCSRTGTSSATSRARSTTSWCSCRCR